MLGEQRIIAIANQKGGVGKTTTAFNFAGCLTEAGKKVLLVDLDPQANLTLCFGVDFPDELEQSIRTLFLAMMERRGLPEMEGLLLSSEGIDLIPANIELTAIELSLAGVMSREQILKKILKAVGVGYDYILIDCAPSLGLLTVNALTAAHSVIIPTQPEFFSVKGLELFFGTIQQTREDLNPQLAVEGILLTQYDSRPLEHRRTAALIQENYRGAVPIFESIIPRNIAVSEANNKAQSVTLWRPNSKASEMYRQFTREVLGKEQE